MLELIQTVSNLLSRGESVVLATIVSRSGSTPRTAGAKMAIRADGQIVGTIGGGLVEARVIEAAKQLFDSQTSRIMPFDLRSADVMADMDMICGGAIDVLLEFVPALPPRITLNNALQNQLENGAAAVLVAELTTFPDQALQIERFLLGPTDTSAPIPGLDETMLCKIREGAQGCLSTQMITIENRRFLVEPFAPKPTLFLLGAGHVAQKVAPLAQGLDFRTVVVDDRKAFCEGPGFETAHQRMVVKSFDNALEDLSINDRSFVVIMTRGHSHDRVVLEQALRSKAGYIGMIGSRRKRELIFKAILETGFTRDDLKRVHCPIGLDIKAETPAEIAVSIVGELIQIRADLGQRATQPYQQSDPGKSNAET